MGTNKQYSLDNIKSNQLEYNSDFDDELEERLE
jgi:hypothetical protein